MAIWPDELRGKAIRYVHETIGGGTYLVEMEPGNWRALCFRPLVRQVGAYCSHPAGWKTPHVGTGRCLHHMGAIRQCQPQFDPLKPRSIGAKKKMKHDNQRKIQSYRAVMNTLEPGYELRIHELNSGQAYLKHMFEVYSQELAELDDEDKDSYLVDRLLSIQDRIVKTANANATIESKRALTEAQLALMMTEAMAVFSDFVQPGRLREFRDAWYQRVSKHFPELAPPDLELGQRLLGDEYSDDDD